MLTIAASSSSFSLLPSEPKVFHGRQEELVEIVDILSRESPRVAILGAGGMGKTSLARAVLHHTDVLARYENRFFVPCDSTFTSNELASTIGAHLGLKAGTDLRKAVARYFAQRPSSLLVLDNLETPWESTESRAGVEEFLSQLTDVPHLALVVSPYHTWIINR